MSSTSHVSLATRVTQSVLIILGCFCVALGVLGLFLPVMPTTVFILMAAWCFSRSSEKFDLWLLNQPLLGSMINNWRTNCGITEKDRNRALMMMWLGMLLSILIVAKLWVSGLLVLIGASLSIYLLRLPLLMNKPVCRVFRVVEKSRCPLRPVEAKIIVSDVMHER